MKRLLLLTAAVFLMLSTPAAYATSPLQAINPAHWIHVLLHRQSPTCPPVTVATKDSINRHVEFGRSNGDANPASDKVANNEPSPEVVAALTTLRPPNMVHVVERHADGTIFSDQWVHNLRTNAGINWQYNQMAGTTAAVCTYIGLTNTAITPSATDTTLSGEITANNMGRALATPTHSSNATSYTLSYTWTASGNQAAQAAGMFNANYAGGGTMCFENTFTSASLANGDTLTVSWTISF